MSIDPKLIKKKIFEKIKTFLIKNGCSKNLKITTKFKDLNFDSLDLMDLVIQMEKKTNIFIPDDQLLLIKTAKDLVDILYDLSDDKTQLLKI